MTLHNTADETEFFRTLSEGNEAGIRACVANNPGLLESFDYRNFGATPLTMVCFGNRPDTVQLLLELGRRSE